MKAARYEVLRAERNAIPDEIMCCGPPPAAGPRDGAMGLAPGGRMKQQILDDPYGLDAWDQRHGSRCFVSLLNTARWMACTGGRPPSQPPTARDYTARGLPWFDFYEKDARALAGSVTLRGLQSAATHAAATRKGPLPDNETIVAPHVVGEGKRRPVRECRGA